MTDKTDNIEIEYEDAPLADDAVDDEGAQDIQAEDDRQDDEPADGAGDDEGGEGRDWEAEAVKLGWHSSGHKSAEQFVKDGEEIGLGLKRKMQVMEDEHRREIESTRAMTELALKKQREALERQYNGEIRNAVETGDVDAYDRLSAQRDKDLQGFELEPDESASPAVDPGIMAWKARHSQWFEQDRAKTAYATAEFQALIDANPGANQADLLPALDAKISAVFPDLYGVAPRRQARQITDRGGRGRASGANKKMLPAGAKKIAKSLIDQGIYKTEQEYAKDYFAMQEGTL